jgi:hypothetical protein
VFPGWGREAGLTGFVLGPEDPGGVDEDYDQEEEEEEEA